MKMGRRGLMAGLLLLTLLGGFLPGAWADDRRTDPSTLVSMTVNGEFLWDGVAPEESSADFPWKGSQTEAEERMSRVAQLIIQGNPDVVNLVEVENLAALTTFNTKFLPAARGLLRRQSAGTATARARSSFPLCRLERHHPESGQPRRRAAIPRAITTREPCDATD